MNAIVVLNLKFYEQALNDELVYGCTVQVSRNAKNCVVRYNYYQSNNQKKSLPSP